MDTGVEGVALLTIFVLSAFTGYEVISKVSTVLHTPLLSGANAIHGVILIGAILVAGTAEGTVELAIGLLAVTLATVNLVGGFVVTDRMLHMFSRGRPALAGGGSGVGSGGGTAKESGAPKQRRTKQPGTKQPGPAKPETEATGSEAGESEPSEPQPTEQQAPQTQPPETQQTPEAQRAPQPSQAQQARPEQGEDEHG